MKNQDQLELNLKEETNLEEPKKFKVFLLNDDYSTMDFVIDVLRTIFRKSSQQSEIIMLNIHNNGRDLCGIYTNEIASTKIAQVKSLARQNGFPLKAIMEEE